MVDLARAACLRVDRGAWVDSLHAVRGATGSGRRADLLPSAGRPMRGKRILFYDPDPRARRVAERALAATGSEIVCAHDSEDLMAKVSDLAGAELVDSLHGLIDMGYVSADTAAFYSAEDMEKILFRVNSGYAKDLREALDPRPQKKKSRRVRRE